MAGSRSGWPLAVLAALALGLAGCGSAGGRAATDTTAAASSAAASGAGSDTPATGASSGGAGSASSTSGLPPPESGGAEQPQQPDSGQPSIELAGLPVGGGTTGEGSIDQCLGVNWLGGDGTNVIPTGVRITVDKQVVFSPDGYFALGGSGCSDQGSAVPCLDRSFGPGDETAACVIAIQQVSDPADFTDVHVTLKGTATCPTAAVCRALRDTLAGSSITVTAEPRLVHPPAPEPPASSTTGGGSPTSSPAPTAPAPGGGVPTDTATTSDTGSGG